MFQLQVTKGLRELMRPSIKLHIGPECTKTSNSISLPATLARESKAANNLLLACFNPFRSLPDLGKSSPWTSLPSYPLPSRGMMRSLSLWMCYPKWYISSPPKQLPLLLKPQNSSLTTFFDSMDYQRSSYPIEIPSSPVDFGKPCSRSPESNSRCPQPSIPRLMDRRNELTNP